MTCQAGYLKSARSPLNSRADSRWRWTSRLVQTSPRRWRRAAFLGCCRCGLQAPKRLACWSIRPAIRRPGRACCSQMVRVSRLQPTLGRFFRNSSHDCSRLDPETAVGVAGQWTQIEPRAQALNRALGGTDDALSAVIAVAADPVRLEVFNYKRGQETEFERAHSALAREVDPSEQFGRYADWLDANIAGTWTAPEDPILYGSWARRVCCAGPTDSHSQSPRCRGCRRRGCTRSSRVTPESSRAFRSRCPGRLIQAERPERQR